MKYILVIFFSLVQGAESGLSANLDKCVNPASPAAMPRPLPPPTACKNKDPTICTAVFDPIGADAADNANP